MSIKVTGNVVIDDNRNVIANANVKIGTLAYSPANSVLWAQSSTAGYNQVIIQNTNAGTTSSSDIVVNNDVSTDTTYYGDFGMNSSTFTGTGNLALANAVYLSAANVDLVIGTTTANSIHFAVAAGANDVMTISSTGATQMNGQISQNITAVAASDIDLSKGQYFTKTIVNATTFTFSNPTTTQFTGFVLELTNGGANTVVWPGAVKWPAATAPTLTVSGVDVLTFITDDTGTAWRGMISMTNSS